MRHLRPVRLTIPLQANSLRPAVTVTGAANLRSRRAAGRRPSARCGRRSTRGRSRHLRQRRPRRRRRARVRHAGHRSGDEDSPLPVTASEVGPPRLAALLAAHTYTYRTKTRKTKTAAGDLPAGGDAAGCRARRRAGAERVAQAAAALRDRRRPGPAPGRHAAAAARIRPGDRPVPGEQVPLDPVPEEPTESRSRRPASSC